MVGALVVLAYFKFVAPPAGSSNPCPGGERHCIPVYVITVGGKPKIADIPDHEVRDQGAAIFWKIGTPGYTFPVNGIAFDKPSNPPSTPTEFNCNVQGNDTFKCIDKKNNLGTFGYTVKLQGSPAVPPLDPYIINN